MTNRARCILWVIAAAVLIPPILTIAGCASEEKRPYGTGTHVYKHEYCSEQKRRCDSWGANKDLKPIACQDYRHWCVEGGEHYPELNR